MKLASKIAVVTGAARGIGLAIAGELCAAGAAVILTDMKTGDLITPFAKARQ